MSENIPKPGEWRSGWPLLAASIAGMSTVVFYSSSLGAMMKAIVVDTGWSRGQVSSAVSIVHTAVAILSPLIGLAMDRLGARPVVLFGLVATAAVLAAAGLPAGSVWTWYAMWALMGVFMGFIQPIGWTLAINSRFVTHRGLALGLAVTGIGLGISFIPPLTVFLLSHVGWRLAYAILGCLAFAVSFPLAWCWFFEGPSRVVGASDVTEMRLGMSRGEAVRSIRFWQLAVAVLMTAVGPGAMIVHFQPMLTDGGVSAARAADLAALIGVSSIFSRLACGYLLDRVHAPIVGAIILLLVGVGTAGMFHFSGELWRAYFTAICVGLALGSEMDLIAYLVSRYFGLRHYGAIFGLLFSCYSLGYGGASWLGGVLYDYSGSYGPFTLILTALCLIGAALMLTLGRYPTFETSQGTDEEIHSDSDTLAVALTESR